MSNGPKDCGPGDWRGFEGFPGWENIRFQFGGGGRGRGGGGRGRGGWGDFGDAISGIVNEALSGAMRGGPGGPGGGRGRMFDGGELRLVLLKLIEDGPYTPTAAKAAGLVNRIAYPDQVEAEVAKGLNLAEVKIERKYGKKKVDPAEFSGLAGMMKLMQQLSGETNKKAANNKPKVAIIFASGLIQNGKSSSGSILGQSVMGSDTVIKHLREAEKDKTVKAIVLRVDLSGFPGLITSPSALEALWLSLHTAWASTALCIVLGVPLSTVLARTGFRGQGLVRSLVLLPLVLALYVLLVRPAGEWRQLLRPELLVAAALAGVSLAFRFLVMPTNSRLAAAASPLRSFPRVIACSMNARSRALPRAGARSWNRRASSGKRPASPIVNRCRSMIGSA